MQMMVLMTGRKVKADQVQRELLSFVTSVWWPVLASAVVVTLQPS